MLRSLLFTVILFCAFRGTAQTTVGLLGYWSFSGNYTNTGPAAASASGVNTSFTTNVCNASNAAVQFQGNVNSYIDFIDNGNFDFTGSQNFTVGFSFFFNGSSSFGLVDNCLNYGGWGVWGWSTVAGTWNLQFNYKNNSVGSAAATNFPIGTWHHATAVRNNGTISLYIDGVFRLSAAEGTMTPAYPLNMISGAFAYGGFNPPRYNPFGGKIDELRIYNRALTAAEIMTLSNVALTACCASSSVLAVSGPSTICAGSTANLTTTITGGVSPYTVVYTNGSSNFTVNNYVSGTNIPVTPSVTTSYSLISVTDANACVGSGNSGNPTITVTPLPAATISYAGSPYCSNAGTASVTRTGTAGGTYSSTAGLIINSTTGDVTLGTSTPGTYTVTYTIAAGGGCPAVTATTSITITALPAATISYTGSPYCSNAGTATVTRTGTAGGTYSSTAGLIINSTTGDVTPGTSTPGTYTVTYTIAAGGGCPAVTATTSITISALPAATISYTGSPYCSNAGTATVTRTGTAGGTYSAAPAGLSINATTGDVTLGTSTPGTYTVTYTIAAAGGCAVFTTTTSITITQLPAATISYTGSPYCSNAGTATVTRTGTAGGTYSAAPAGLSINATTGDVTPGTSTPGTYTVTYTIAASGGCPVVTATTTITITQLPAATINYAGSPYCSNAGIATVTRTGTAGGTYSSTAGLIINAITGDVTLATSTPGTYTVTCTIAASGGCPVYTTTTTITITASPITTISYAGSPYCSNAGTATVTRTGTAGGTYSSTAGLIINAITGDVTLATSTPGTYTVTYTIAAGGGCSVYSTTTSITVTASPITTINYAGSPYCSNAGTAMVTRTGTAGGTYSSTAGLTINTTTGDVTLGTSTPGTYTVTYAVTSGGGCSVVTTTTTITITALPAATINYAGSPYCSNAGTATVTRTGTAGGTYSSTPGLTINATTGDVTLGTSTPGTYTVTYTIAAGGGCPAVTATTSITIAALPAATISYAGSPYCSNAGTATVTRTGTAGGTYSSTAGLIINSTTGDVALGTSTPGTYTVTYTIAAGGGCPAVTATTSITITALAAATISYAGSPYCSNAGTASVTRTGTAGGAYSSTAGLIINSTTGDVTLGTSTPGTYTVTYTIAAGGGCAAVTATTSITITAFAAATISYAGSPYCSNAGTASVTRTGTAGGTYSASPAGLALNAANGDVILGTSTPGTYTVTYTIAAGSGCPAITASTSITIITPPTASIVYTGSPYCSNAGTAMVTRTGTGGGTYSASPAGLSLNAANGNVTLATSTPGTYTVTYTIAAGGGCPVFTTTAVITITPTPTASISYTGSPYCSTVTNAPVTLTGTPGGTFTATPAGLTINASTGTVNPATSTPGTYTVTIAGCATATATTIITITALPNMIIFYLGTPYCSNSGTATVSRFGTAGGTYSASPAGLSINPTTGAVTLGTSTPGTYTVTYSVTAPGCGVTNTFTTITVTAAPNATISYAGSPYCSNAGTANVTITGAPTTGTFSSTAGLSINAATGAVNLAASTAGTYTVTYTVAASGGCAQYTTTTTITITTLPAATIAYTGCPYCSNAGTATVTRTGTAGGTYSAAPAGLSINAATGDVNLAASTAGTYTVTYTIAAGGGCPAVTATASITITAVPAATISYAGNPFCQPGGIVAVTRTGTAGGTYSAAPAGLSINGATGDINVTISTPGTYTVTYTLAAGGGCPAQTATTSVTINSVSVAATAATATATSLCNPGTVTLSVVGGTLGSNSTWRWYSGSCGGTLVGTGATLNVTVNTTTTYFVRAEGPCNTTTCASVTVTVNVQPTVTITSTAIIIKPGQPAILTATVTPAGTPVQWYRNGIAVPGATATTLTVGVADYGTYTARATTAAGCTAISTGIPITAESINNVVFVYPNPNNGQFQVRIYNQPGKQLSVVVFNSFGQKVYGLTQITSAPYTRMDVDIRNAAGGQYTVVVVDGDGLVIGSKPIVIAR